MRSASFMLICIWFVAICVAWMLDLQANVISLDRILAAPDSQFWLGNDDLGRDIFARLLSGAEVSFMVAILVTGITLTIGVTLGLISGFYGGWIDRLLMQITDVFLAFPGILLAIAFAAVLGPGLNNLILALCLTSWVGYARLTRAQALSLRNSQHVQAAESLGASVPRMMFRHMLPLLAAPLVVEATYSIAGLVIAEASLSFLGLGQQPPDPSWGSMLNTAKNFITQAPWMAIWPGLAIFVVVFGFNILGDGLRDALDPRDSR
jgi:peptide/nickel transport system permease protein